MRIVSLSGSRMVNIGRQTLEQKSVGVTRDSRGERSMTISSTAVSACGGGLSLNAGLLIKAAARSPRPCHNRGNGGVRLA
jgi:hypothetical protein